MKKILGIISIILVVGVVVGTCTWSYFYFTSDEKINPSGDISGDSDVVISTDPLWSGENFPKVDGSTATQPLINAFWSNFTGTPIDELVTDYSKTHPAYVKLINDEVDLIIVTQPSHEELELAKQKGVELEVIPVVNEAFVFLANVQNEVDDLTIEEIQNIYSGKITNWNEVGGSDSKILPYQRPTNSGSQTGMIELVMKDVDMIEPLTETFEETMAGLITAIADYDNAKDALGYSYYYYATTMYSKANVKLLSVNGVEPNFDTIQKGEYPIGTYYYIVINAAEPEGSPTRQLVKAMLSPRGQIVAKEAGYVPVKK